MSDESGGGCHIQVSGGPLADGSGWKAHASISNGDGEVFAADYEINRDDGFYETERCLVVVKAALHLALEKMGAAA